MFETVVSVTLSNIVEKWREECKNTIELDWTGDVNDEHNDCSGKCHGCHGCNDEDDDM